MYMYISDVIMIDLPFAQIKKNLPFQTVADIPGLIPGAHLNKGLGISFLRHVERCKSLLFVLDGSSSDPDMATQLQALKHELKCYRADLGSLASLIVANKMDLVESRREQLDPLLQIAQVPVIPISGLHHWNTSILVDTLVKMVHP